MGLTDPTILYSAGAEATVEPVVLFSIIDHYSRRDEGQDFVIGTLLGTEENGVVTVCSSFPVPHTEVEDQIALNTDFHTTMLALQQRVHPKQTVVGWYSTGESVNVNTKLFHDFYGQVRATPRRACAHAPPPPAAASTHKYHPPPSPRLACRPWSGPSTCCLTQGWASGA
jgi:hypothetical protein